MAFSEIGASGRRRLVSRLRWLRGQQRIFVDRVIDRLFSRLAGIMRFANKGLRHHRTAFLYFDPDVYLHMNPDVKAAGVEPFQHYLRHGIRERRPAGRLHHHTLAFAAQRSHYRPKVSVIVPNFNHGPYLRQRLNTIYKQSYRNFEVILLDDCSTDGSPSLIASYASRYRRKTRCRFNATNSGSPFSQWEQGLSLADGDLIWIAESDDYCDRDFLATLVPFFADDSVLLSYAEPVFVTEDGRRHSFTFESYVGQINRTRWTSSYVETAHNEVNDALGLLNTIPNVSGVLFRKPDSSFRLFDDQRWKKMRVCGDWLFYLHLIRSGRVAYSRRTKNYYRIYDSSSSKLTHSQNVYYEEHEQVAAAVASLYKIQPELMLRFQARLKKYYLNNVPDGTVERFESLFDIGRILGNMSTRQPNVLMASYAFAAGGGETFPVQLANAMHKGGAAVTFFNGGYEPTQPGLRNLLARQIPVVERTSVRSVDELLADFGSEIIHSHHASMEDYFAVNRTIGTPGVRHIATMHGMYEMMADAEFVPHTRNIRKSVDHWVYTADKNLAPFTRHGLSTLTGFTKIDNGLPIRKFAKVDLRSLGIGPDSFTACLASRAIAEKGWLEAIEATGLAREATRRDVHLLLIGNGPMYDALQSTQLPDFVHLLGFKPNVGDYLASAQLGLVPSYFKGESFPFVIIECFIAGIPVVASNIGEIPRVIRTEDGRNAGAVIELRDGKSDPRALAESMTRLIADKDFYDSCVDAVRVLLPRFDIATVAQQYLALYQHSLGPGALGPHAAASPAGKWRARSGATN